MTQEGSSSGRREVKYPLRHHDKRGDVLYFTFQKPEDVVYVESEEGHDLMYSFDMVARKIIGYMIIDYSKNKKLEKPLKAKIADVEKRVIKLYSLCFN